jgi:IS30 family transposase
MHPKPLAHTIQQLHQANHSLREISRLLGISRNSVRRLIRQKSVALADSPELEDPKSIVAQSKSSRYEEHLPLSRHS